MFSNLAGQWRGTLEFMLLPIPTLSGGGGSATKSASHGRFKQSVKRPTELELGNGKADCHESLLTRRNRDWRRSVAAVHF
jgi:hypothetical protein